MKTTMGDIRKIVNAERIEITAAYPLDDRPEGIKWYMAQPSDWLYDIANAVRDAAIAEVLSLPEMETAKNLPPNADWIKQQEKAKKDTEKRIAELEKRAKKDALTPEEDLEMQNLKDLLERIVTPGSNMTRADEIARNTGIKAFERWLMPRLIVDENGALLFDPDTEEGRERWSRVGLRLRDSELRAAFYEVILLVNKAKN